MTPDLAKALEFFDNNRGIMRGDDVVPPGFFSARQMTRAKGLSLSGTHHIKMQLDELVSAGYAERKILKIGRYHTAYYKVKE